jgi:hypothetical protein
MARRVAATGARGIVVAGVLFLLLGVFSRAVIFRPATSLPGSAFNQGGNAIWLAGSWISQPRQSSEVTELFERLSRNQVRTAYVYAGTLGTPDVSAIAYSGQLTGELGASFPEIEVLAWLDLPADTRRWTGESARKQFAESAASLVREHRFDGLHLNALGVSSGERALPELLDALRLELPRATHLSIAVPRLLPLWGDLPVPFGGASFWQRGYYREVARGVSQVAVLSYSQLPSPELERVFQRFETIALTDALKDVPTALVIGIPTSARGAASVGPFLEGLIAGLNDLESQPDAVDGLGIYPEWETDEAEWRAYERLWLGR